MFVLHPRTYKQAFLWYREWNPQNYDVKQAQGSVIWPTPRSIVGTVCNQSNGIRLNTGSSSACVEVNRELLVILCDLWSLSNPLSSMSLSIGHSRPASTASHRLFIACIKGTSCCMSAQTGCYELKDGNICRLLFASRF